MWGDRWGFDPVAEINESSTYEAASRDARSRDLVPVCLSSLTPLRPFEPRAPFSRARQLGRAGPVETRNGYTSGDTWPVKMLISTEAREFRRNFTWRDGRVVDGGGLESINALSAEFAFFGLNSPRHAR